MTPPLKFGWADLLLSLLVSLAWTALAAQFTPLDREIVVWVGIGVFWATELLTLRFIHLRLTYIDERVVWVQRKQ
jgi:hypothetical protein